MVYKKKPTRKKSVIKRRSNSKPIGYVKQGKSYKLVFGTKSKPRLSKSAFRTKAGLLKKARSLIK